MKTTILAFIFGAITMSPALACDNPGTPNPVSAFAINSSTIQLKITNTATEGSEHTIWFLAQDRKGDVQRFTQGRILDGDFAVFNETKLVPNMKYCFRVWTRVDTIDGCESKQPSGYVCATTQPPYPPALSVSNNVKEDPSSTPAQPDSGPITTPVTTSGPTYSTKNGLKCCNDPIGSFDNLCCGPGLICPVGKNWYCSAIN